MLAIPSNWFLNLLHRTFQDDWEIGFLLIKMAVYGCREILKSLKWIPLGTDMEAVAIQRERDIGLCSGASLKSEIYSKRLSSEI